MNSLQGGKFIVGIDYGTTKTCVTSALYDPTRPAMTRIDLVRFDGEVVAPSQIAYDGHGNCYCGEEAVRLGMGYSWTKILLDERQHHGGFHSKLLNSPVNTRFFKLPPNEKCEKIICDFLAHLLHHIQSFLRDNYGNIPLPIEFWFSVPGSWSETARNKMTRAIECAGYNLEGRNAVYMVSEGEAAARFIWQELPAHQVVLLYRPNHFPHSSLPIYPWIQAHGMFMVVDAGGGTTVCVWVCKPDMSLILTIDEDITTFSSQTTLHGRAFIQQMASVGLHLGGAEIDCSFVSYLEPQISQAYQKRLQQDPQLFAKFMGAIENLKLHMNGTLMASNSVAINSAEAGEQGRMIKTIFLVGGLTQCGYIGTKLRHELQALGNVTVVTLQAYTPHMVAYGATLRGLAGASQVSVKAIRSYCLESVAPPDTDSRPGAWGIYSTPGAPRWVIRQDELFKLGDRGVVNLGLLHVEGEALTKFVKIFSCWRQDNEGPPESIDGRVEQAGVVGCSLAGTPLANSTQQVIEGIPRYYIPLRVTWTIGMEEPVQIEFVVSTHGRQIGRAAVSLAWAPQV
ncbi:Hsp70 family protein [Aspergillus puulaauensis]|uniref:Actin-like ATPase domain-containing protein n=1 Tax=Aspergillus puulaauensis TaxID=1220207 RepID=A0A7R7XJL4_9EURO|nr:uncharacterized protein APUU_30682S [Aspergillus puulaauensis]BCS22457.1 hypothetical protein APUU_30682S [Aspergillus puulaauensis]